MVGRRWVSASGAIQSLLFLAFVQRAWTHCVANDSPDTQEHCNPSYSKICYRKDNGAVSAVCMTCNEIENYNCNACSCEIKAGWLAAFVAVPVMVLVLWVGCCCYYCRVCLWYRLRTAAEPVFSELPSFMETVAST